VSAPDFKGPILMQLKLEARRTRMALPIVALGLLLAGCDARFTVDFGTDAPADPDIVSVEANVLGLDLRRDDGSTVTLEFRTGELVDLFDLKDGDPLRLFTDEELPAGRYTGVRLLFDADEGDNAVTAGNDEFPLLLADGEFAAVDFLVEDEERSLEKLTLMLDLRQSLAFDDARAEYTLTPRLRAIRTDDAARIEGAVTVACPAGTTLATGGAVYLFAGADVQPDDLDGAGAEPLATTRVVVDPFFASSRYALRFLPAGEYTLALTCRGNEDVLGVDDDLAFRNVANVQLDADDVLLRNLN
jgi:hypothetical protein